MPPEFGTIPGSEVVWESYHKANVLVDKAQNVGEAIVLASRVLETQRHRRVRTTQTLAFWV